MDHLVRNFVFNHSTRIVLYYNPLLFEFLVLNYVQRAYIMKSSNFINV